MGRFHELDGYAFATSRPTVNSSPSDFHLYEVGADDEVRFVGASPYHGGFRVTNVYAFDGSPPEHLITDTGIFLDLAQADCSIATMVANEQCLMRDGALGTLAGAQVFIGMTNHGATLYSLVDPSPSFSLTEVTCANGCLLQRIDVEARLVIDEEIVHFDLERLVSMA